MSFDWVIWGPPLVVLLGGLVVGLVVALQVQGRSVVSRQEKKDAMRVAKDNVLEALRELESHRARLAPEEYEERRVVLLTEGASFLHALEMEEEETLVSPAPGSEKRSMAWAWWVVSLGFAGMAFLLLRGAEVPRQGEQPMTGGSDVSSSRSTGGMNAVIEQRIAQATSDLETNPHDVAALNTLIHFSLLQGDMQGAMQRFMQVRTVAPEDKDVIAHGAALAILVNILKSFYKSF